MLEMAMKTGICNLAALAALMMVAGCSAGNDNNGGGVAGTGDGAQGTAASANGEAGRADAGAQNATRPPKPSDFIGKMNPYKDVKEIPNYNRSEIATLMDASFQTAFANGGEGYSAKIGDSEVEAKMVAGRRYVLATSDGANVADGDFDMLRPAGGNLVAAERKGGWALLEATGKSVAPLTGYDYLYIGDLKNGRILAYSANDRVYFVLDPKGNVTKKTNIMGLYEHPDHPGFYYGEFIEGIADFESNNGSNRNTVHAFFDKEFNNLFHSEQAYFLDVAGVPVFIDIDGNFSWLDTSASKVVPGKDLGGGVYEFGPAGSPLWYDSRKAVFLKADGQGYSAPEVREMYQAEPGELNRHADNRDFGDIIAYRNLMSTLESKPNWYKVCQYGENGKADGTRPADSELVTGSPAKPFQQFTPCQNVSFLAMAAPWNEYLVLSMNGLDIYDADFNKIKSLEGDFYMSGDDFSTDNEEMSRDWGTITVEGDGIVLSVNGKDMKLLKDGTLVELQKGEGNFARDDFSDSEDGKAGFDKSYMTAFDKGKHFSCYGVESEKTMGLVNQKGRVVASYPLSDANDCHYRFVADKDIFRDELPGWFWMMRRAPDGMVMRVVGLAD